MVVADWGERHSEFAISSDPSQSVYDVAHFEWLHEWAGPASQRVRAMLYKVWVKMKLWKTFYRNCHGIRDMSPSASPHFEN